MSARSTTGTAHPVRTGPPRGVPWLDLLVAAVVLAEAAVLTRLPVAPKKYGDWTFHAEAKELSKAVRGATPWAGVAITKAPGPVFYYAVPYLLVPPGSPDPAYWRAGVTLSVVCVAAGAVLLKRSAALAFGPAAGLVAAGLGVASPLPVYYSFGIGAEVPAYLGVVLGVYGWARWKHGQGSGRSRGVDAWLCGLGLSGFLLSRPNGLVVFPVIAACAFALRRKDPSAARFVLVSAAVAVGAVALGTAAVRALPGGPGSNSQLDYLSHVAFHGRFQFRKEPLDWRFWDDSTRAGSVDYADWARADRSLRDLSGRTGRPLPELQRWWIFKDVAGHPLTVLRAAGVRAVALNTALVNSRPVALFRLGPLRGLSAYVLVHAALNLANWLAVTGAAWVAWRQKGRVAGWVVLWGPWVSLLAFHSLIYCEPRYLFPGQPGLVVLASALAGSAARLDAAGRPLIEDS